LENELEIEAEVVIEFEVEAEVVIEFEAVTVPVHGCGNSSFKLIRSI